MPNYRQRAPRPKLPPCPCGKYVYVDEIAAKFALAQLGFKAIRKKHKSHRQNDEARVYCCEYGNWHLTSQERRRS